QFALRVIRLYEKLPRTGAAAVIGKQVLRSGTSVGAQYREAMRARTTAEFVSKTGTALQELEETAYWLELLGDAEIVAAERLEFARRSQATACDICRFCEDGETKWKKVRGAQLIVLVYHSSF